MSPKPGVHLSERASAATSVAGGAATKSPLLRLLTVERDGNPLRRYGHVSPHIGKLAPLDADALDGIARLAATSLPPDARSGPTLVVGTAESALLLAWFLTGQLASQPGGDVDLRFTTREHRRVPGNGTRLTFLEPHSHGPVHSLVFPAGRSYSRVVIVEDELTTGATLRNLLHEIRDVSPRCHVVTLADSRPEESRERLREEMSDCGVELSVADLSLAADEPTETRNGDSPSRHNPFGRPLEVMAGAVEELRRRWIALRPEYLYAIGECVDVAMTLWESLAPEERPVFRHVTRSPWLVDGGTITSRLDLCASRAPRHFLYNHAEEDLPRRALLVGERSTAPVARRLRRFLTSRGVEAGSVEVPHA